MLYGEMLTSLKNDCNAMASAIVSKDGSVVASDVPEDISKETFAIMSATILGASVTASTELKKEAPTKVIFESEDTKTIIMNASRQRILVVVVPSSTESDLVEESSQVILTALRKE
jgi:predicted regulator of Ras-like GTPase activity (Roadblock/LC7/MglB family)